LPDDGPEEWVWPRAQRSDHKNQTWDPLRIETLDPDRNWIACFIHDTGFDHNRSRARQAQLTS
jgi:hypothetical protein